MTTCTQGQVDDPANRQVHDFYPTYPAATRALLRNERFLGPVWEPACGAGDISRVLKQEGFSVNSTDLYDYGYGSSGHDFLTYSGPRFQGNIITNPPFKHAQEFIEQALRSCTGKVAMFLRLAFLKGVGRSGKPGRKHLFEATPLSTVYVMSRRVPMQRGRLAEKGDSTGVVAFSWMVWDTNANYFDDTVLKFLDWKEYENADA